METVERPDTRERETDKSPDLFHYADKTKVLESAVMGTVVKALCGAVFPATKVPKPGSAVCQACKEIYEDDARMAAWEG
jgi:hypothetical protein